MARTGFNTKSELIKGTEEQEAIWQELLDGQRHVIVEAVAGSGKTFTLVQYALRANSNTRIGLVAFNKHIASELSSKVNKPNVECMTYHSLGFKAIRNATRKPVKVNQYKVHDIMDSLNIPLDGKSSTEKMVKVRIAQLCGLAKTYGLKPLTLTKQNLEDIAELHDVETGEWSDAIYYYTPIVLNRCTEDLSQVDFDDMVWLPSVLDLPVPKYDMLCVDEYQDTGLTQQWLALRGGYRVCAVGDPRQAIYQWRGADSKGFERLRVTLGEDKVVTLPLTLTRRCAKLHVEMAQVITPQIRALDNAPQGIIRKTNTLDAAISEMKPGDMVLCRVNADLMQVAYKLLKRNVRAVVRGRDVGVGLEKLIDKSLKLAGADCTIPLLLKFAGEITGDEVDKFMALPHGRGEGKALIAQDKYDCLVELAQAANSVTNLKSIIADLFEDFDGDGTPKNAVVLGTVHRTKGLEANRIYILRPDLIPHPMAKKPSEIEGERNLAYVAVTRAKFGDLPGELVFVGGWCGLFPTKFLQEGHQEPQSPPSTTRNTPQEVNAPYKPTSQSVNNLTLEGEYEEDLAQYAVEEELDSGGIPEHRRWN